MFFPTVCPTPLVLDRRRIDPRRRRCPDRQTRDRAWAGGRDKAFHGEMPWPQCVVLVVSSNGTAPVQRRATRPDSFASHLGPCCRRRRAQKNARTERNETVGPRDKISRRGRPAAPKSALLNLQKKRDKKGGGPRRPKATRGGGAVSSAPLLFFFLSAFCRGKSGRVLFSRLYLFFFLEFFCLHAVSGYGAGERRARAGTAQAATRKQ